MYVNIVLFHTHFENSLSVYLGKAVAIKGNKVVDLAQRLRILLYLKLKEMESP